MRSVGESSWILRDPVSLESGCYALIRRSGESWPRRASRALLHAGGPLRRRGRPPGRRPRRGRARGPRATHGRAERSVHRARCSAPASAGEQQRPGPARSRRCRATTAGGVLRPRKRDWTYVSPTTDVPRQVARADPHGDLVDFEQLVHELAGSSTRNDPIPEAEGEERGPGADEDLGLGAHGFAFGGDRCDDACPRVAGGLAHDSALALVGTGCAGFHGRDPRREWRFGVRDHARREPSTRGPIGDRECG